MSLSIAAVLNVIFQTPQPRDLPNLVRKRLHLVQISLSQEILRMNKNSLRGGGSKKVLFENEQMPCVCPAGVEFFCDRKQRGASVKGTVNSANEKSYASWKMKNRQMGISVQLRRHESLRFLMCGILCPR